jgi:molybdate transport system permease protein
MPVDRYWLAPGAETAVLATAIALLLGVSLAWILQNRQFAGKRAAETAAGTATVLPAPLLCYYLLAQLGHRWPLTRLGLAVSGVVSVLPFLLRRSRASFAALNPSFAKAARSLGVSEWRVFTRVELPLVWRPVLAGAGWALSRLLLELAAALWIAEARL